MNICVLGLWHLGSVISASVASKGHKVIGIDDNTKIINNLNRSKAPIYEPHLNKLIKNGLNSGNLTFTDDKKKAISAKILWVTFDTPVNENDNADTNYVENQVKKIMSNLKKNTIILFSSQLPVGSIKKMKLYSEKKFPDKKLKFACSPENLRLGNSLEIFLKPDRVIIGVAEKKTKIILSKFFKTITNKIEWMTIESAEMTKHALNSFLATSIIFANEIASVCEKVGADASEVERGLKTDNRIGKKAYLSPGNPIAGGTLLRDVNFLNNKKKKLKLQSPLLSSLVISNNIHKNWISKKLLEKFDKISNLSIAVWGLTYKPYTDSLRRSLSIELCKWLLKKGAKINVYDPVVKKLPKYLNKKVKMYQQPLKTLENSDVLVIGTYWPAFKKFTGKIHTVSKKKLIIIDPNNDLKIKTLKSDQRYITFGR
jgi:UDPglucose 6-dehydrogenase